MDALAAHRIVRLIQRDTLPPLPELRHQAELALDGSELVELLDCPWCLSPWVATLIGVARTIAPRWWGRLARILAISTIVGLLTDREMG